MLTISSYILGGAGLTTFSSQNPVTVTSGGTLLSTITDGVALFGAGSYDWTIANQGLVEATGTYGVGVYLQAAGTITNQSGGVITGTSLTGFGIFLYDGGYVGNQVHATIAGEIGIYGRNAPATIVNDGAVSGNANAQAGIKIVDGATITNHSSGTISGQVGIWLPSGSGTIVNAGSIAGNAASAPGIVLGVGGYVTNQAAAQISGFDGVFATVLAATAANSGSIAASYAGVLFRAGGTVDNTGTGGISGEAFGVQIGGGPGTVDNQGSIYNTFAYTGSAVGTIQLAGVALTDGGSVSNAGTGTIDGSFFGVRLSGAAGTVVNDGSIFATGNAGNNAAGDAAGVAVLAGGTVENDPTGHISGTWKGVEIGQYGAPATGTLFNQGSIYASNSLGNAGAAVWINGPGLISNASGGTIAGGPYGIVAYQSQDTVLNAGVIESPSYVAVDLLGGGAVTNTGTGLIDGTWFGVRMTGTAGSVVNDGTVISTAVFNYGAAFDAAGIAELAGGTVVNDGSVAATWIGVQIGEASASAGGTLFNSGDIYAYGRPGTIVTGAAVWIHGPGLISNAAQGTIGGGPYGIVAYYQTTVINAGSIGGTGFAVDATPGFADLVVVDPGAVFSGEVSGGNSIGAAIASTLELASGASAGTLSGLGTQFVDFSQIVLDDGATWVVTGYNSLAAQVTVSGGGTLIDAGTLVNGTSLGTDVTVAAGGSFTNAAGGTISGSGLAAVQGPDGGAALVVNAGLIDPGTYGVNLPGGGTVTNVGGAIVGTSAGVKVSGGAGTVSNAGSILASGENSTGVLLISGGSVTNQSGGTIDGTLYGIQSSNAATVGNSGRIGVSAADGIGLASGVVSNAATASISGTGSGVRIYGAGTVSNAGTISGGSDAVYFHGGATDRLVMYPGAVFSGLVNGGNSLGGDAVSTLELASGSGTGTLSGFGSEYLNFAQITIDSGAQWTLGIGNTIVAGQTLTNASTLTVPAGNLADTGVVLNNGLIIADPGLVDLGGAVGGTGLLAIDPGTTLQLDQAVGSGQTVTFADATGTLVLGDVGGFQGTIGSFAQGDEIFVSGATVASDSFVANGLTLFAGDGSTIGTLTFAPAAATAGELFVNAQGGVGGPAPCFAAGTRIATPHGEVAIEDLRVGDVVRTVLRGTAPVVWIGRRAVDCAAHARPRQVWPVRVRAGAFGPGQPHRDVLLSPDHAVYVNGVLVPVKHLINGSSIAQQPVAAVVYYHLELPEHDVLLADGLPAESYLDMKDGSNYARSGGTVRLHPEWPARLWEAAGCAPLVVAGPELAAARAGTYSCHYERSECHCERSECHCERSECHRERSEAISVECSPRPCEHPTEIASLRSQ